MSSHPCIQRPARFCRAAIAEPSLDEHGHERRRAVKALSVFAVALVFTLSIGSFFSLVSLVALAAGLGAASTANTLSTPSEAASADVPPLLLQLFIAEARQCPGLPWTVMAAISKVESDHGRVGGAVIGVDGTVRPPIFGIALDGREETARIPDTDGGRWDRDSNWDRAVGPFQFIPTSWRLFGGDGSGDGVADPQNVHDAVPAMRRHLCPDGQIIDIESAIFSYNRSAAYVRAVLDWAQTYTGPLPSAALPITGYALPVSPGLVDDERLTRPHHDYPAWDLGLPIRTPVFATTAGTVTTASSAGVYPKDPNRCGTNVTVSGLDGATYTYCHLSQLAVHPGQIVNAGTLIGLSGGQPGTAGAGNTTGPHLHLGIRINGVSVCPQPLLLAITRQTPVNPFVAPSAGCVTGRTPTDWPSWINQIGLNPQGEQDAPDPGAS